MHWSSHAIRLYLSLSMYVCAYIYIHYKLTITITDDTARCCTVRTNLGGSLGNSAMEADGFMSSQSHSTLTLARRQARLPSQSY